MPGHGESDILGEYSFSLDRNLNYLRIFSGHKADNVFFGPQSALFQPKTGVSLRTRFDRTLAGQILTITLEINIVNLEHL